MDQLIKITENNGVKAVSARELHKFLDATERFSTWIERQFQYGFIEGQDYVGCKQFNTLANQELNDFALTIDTSKEISMLQKSEKGKQARQYFIECERKSLNPHQVTRKELAYMVIEAEEKAEKYKALAVKNQVRSDYLDKIMASDDKMDIGQAAKILSIPNVGRNTLFKELRDRGYFFKNRNEPKQQYIAQGLFELKEKYVALGNGEEKLTMKVLVTQKGLAFISKWFDVVPKPKTLITLE